MVDLVGKKKRGFFSIELAVAIVLFLIILAVFIPKAVEFINQGKASKAHAELAALGTAISQYQFETGKYPDKLEDLKGTKGQYGPWMKEIHKDPWDNEYKYKHDNKGFVVYSFGADKKDSGSSLDKVSEKDIGFVGK